ncbi:MAG: PIN domain-containing protein [Micropruina sp.]|nr:PIN domain-containing protein [Micropruina sp.]
MSRYLLDANVLIALTVAEHVHHEAAARWFTTIPRAALCPLVEGALVRYLVRVGVPATSVQSLLRALHQDDRIEFWADELSYAEVPLAHVTGHRQVSDAYLAALAVERGGLLATLDRGLVQTLPSSVLLIE